MSTYTEDQESEIEQSVSKISDKSDKPTQKCDHKCVHQGDRICYSDVETKEVVKQIAENGPTAVSTESLEDSLHSGESVFKIFSFETQDQDPDMEKCMAFWKSILAKNAKPIQCSLIKPKTQKETKKKQSKKEASCEAEETKTMWLDIYKDLQRRNLDKIKLVKSKTCDPCADYIDEDEVKKEDQKDIRELNTWKSEEQPSRGKIDLQSQVKRTLQVLQEARTPSQTKIEGKEKHPKSKPKPKLSSAKEKEKMSLIINKQTSNTKPIKIPISLENVVPPTPANSSVGVESQQVAPSVQIPGSELTTLAKELHLKLTDETFCCKCGCDLHECVCEEMLEFTRGDKNPSLQEPEQGLCEPCECPSECVCGRDQQQTKTCPCGCGVRNCICDHVGNGNCTCGCGLDECCCKNLGEKECECGCKIGECVCEELFRTSCKCGQEDCDCGTIEILNAYLETIREMDKGGKGENFVSTEVQTEEEEKIQLETTTEKEGSYCIICGHYNCYCTEKIKIK